MNSSPFRPGLLFAASDVFPLAFGAPQGRILIDVDHPLSMESLCHSPLGRLLISLERHAWILDTDWARQQVPIGIWSMRIPQKDTSAPEHDECTAPMALILLTRMLLHLTGNRDLVPGGDMADSELVSHYQHTNGGPARVHCAWGVSQKLCFIVYPYSEASIQPVHALCRFTPAPA